MEFVTFKNAITQQFERMRGHDLFCTAIDRDEVWQAYLDAFPTGSDLMFRVRTEHDCSCCRQFIRQMGGTVAIVDGELVSLWDAEVKEPAYQVVADAMSAYVKSKAITGPFIHYEPKVGTDKNFEDINGLSFVWSHFHVELPGRNTGRNLVAKKKDIDTLKAEVRSLHDVFLRSLKELKRDAIDTVLELIKQGSLYRGNEHVQNVSKFSNAKRVFDSLSVEQQELFAWDMTGHIPSPVLKIRNTAIGTLLTELSDGMDLEQAVSRFERMVAGDNYKRTTSLVTSKMVENAKATIVELGLATALHRRFAELSDIHINNVLFADRTTAKAIGGDVFDSIATRTATPKHYSKVEEIPVEKFITDVIPNIESMEVFIENRHTPNLVSLIAPVDKLAGRLFKWENPFSWAYIGDVADSVKERVKKAGGNVTGDLCCRLAWFNYDDLDLHMIEPKRHEIYFSNKGPSPCGGHLDVDMNAGSGQTREPVENIFYGNRRTMRDGEYHLFVHQYSKRESDNVGFEVEIDWLGDVKRFAYNKPIKTGDRVLVARMRLSQSGFEIVELLPTSSATKTVWNVKTQGWNQVNVFMRSPNYWDGERGIGNRHYFFMLDGCQNDGSARGFFNEFLKPELDKHRKVFEIVGSKMKAEVSPNQLSGLGFSDTKRAEILTKVKGNFTRTLKVLV